MALQPDSRRIHPAVRVQRRRHNRWENRQPKTKPPTNNPSVTSGTLLVAELSDSTPPPHRRQNRRQPPPHRQQRTGRQLEHLPTHPPIPHTTQTPLHRNHPQNLQRHPEFSLQSRLHCWDWPPFSQHRRLQRRRKTRLSCDELLQQHHLHPPQHNYNRRHHPHLRHQS